MADGDRRGGRPDPLGKRALFRAPPLLVSDSSDPPATSSGKGALFSASGAGATAAVGRTGPTGAGGRDRPARPTPAEPTLDNPIAGTGPITVECSRCRAVSRIGWLDLVIFQLPLGYWLPRGRFDRRMTCPMCRQRVWASVTLRR